MAEVVVGELRNHATRRSGCRIFRTSLEARSEVEKKTALIHIFFCKHAIALVSVGSQFCKFRLPFQ